MDGSAQRTRTGPAGTLSLSLPPPPKLLHLPSRPVHRASSWRAGRRFTTEVLDSKFAIRVGTTITWEDGPDAAIRAVTDMDVWCEVVRPFRLVPKRVLEGTCNAVLRPVLRASLNQFIAHGLGGLKLGRGRFSGPANPRREP